MISRRHFLSTVSGAAAVSALPHTAAAQTTGISLAQSATTAGGKYRPPFRIGLGGAPMGGSSKLPVTDEEAVAILDNAWAAGMRYYDNSPWYGLGLSERRFGQMLNDKKRDEYVLSTKVGRILTGSLKPKATAWGNPDSFDYTYDYSASATRRSIEDSLQRMGLPSIDIVFIHDLTSVNGDLGERWTEYFDQAVKGAMPELTKMKEEGIIKAWGLGVNNLEPILRTLDAADPDIFLAACQYSLIEHEESVTKLFPACEKKGVSIVVGSPFNNGFVTGADRFNYGPNIPVGFKEKRERLQTIAKAHQVDLRTAALQFTAAPATVSATIPGARKRNHPGENVKSMAVKIPADFWAELKQEKLIAEAAPVPA